MDGSEIPKKATWDVCMNPCWNKGDRHGNSLSFPQLVEFAPGYLKLSNHQLRSIQVSVDASERLFARTRSWSPQQKIASPPKKPSRIFVYPASRHTNGDTFDAHILRIEIYQIWYTRPIYSGCLGDEVLVLGLCFWFCQRLQVFSLRAPDRWVKGYCQTCGDSHCWKWSYCNTLAICLYNMW